MGRKAYFKRDEFMDAALKTIAEKGPGGLTVSALADTVKAPVGSVYHRFASRDILLAELWVRVVTSFQQGFLEALATEGIAASLYTVDWVRGHPNEGRLLLLYRREDLLSGEWPEPLKDQVASLSRKLDTAIRSFVKKHFGRVTEETLRRATFALVDVPLAAVRAHLQEGQTPPNVVDRLVREAYLSVMGKER